MTGEEIVGYLDEDGCLIPIKNWEPGFALHGTPVDPAWQVIRERDLDDPKFGWTVTI